MLKNWRKRMGFNLAEAATFLGLSGASQVFFLERGETFPSPPTIAQIEGATKGEITVADHWAAWRRFNAVDFNQFRAAGRSAAKAHRPPATKRRK